MSTMDSYSTEEWATITAAPMLAGSYIAIADPGITSLLSESSAMMKAMTSGDVPSDASELIGSIVAKMKEMAANKEKIEMPGLSDEDKKDPAATKAAMLEQIKSAAATVAAKGTAAEAAGYKEWLMSVANATAEASREGGFMGIGGTRVSDQEKTALADLGSAMGL